MDESAYHHEVNDESHEVMLIYERNNNEIISDDYNTVVRLHHARQLIYNQITCNSVFSDDLRASRKSLSTRQRDG